MPGSERGAVEEAARETVRGLDPDARILGILLPDPPRGASADAVETTVALAAAAAEIRGRTLLANFVGAGEALDRRMGVTGARGLVHVLRGEAELTGTAVRPEGERFLYLPRGAPSAADDAAPGRDLLDDRRFRSLAERVRRAEGTLLLCLTPRALAGDGADDDAGGAAVFDGIIRIGDVAVPAGSRPAELAHLSLPSVEPGATVSGPGISAETEAARSRGSWHSHRRTRRLPMLRIGGGAALILVLFAGWWFLADGLLPGTADAGVGASGSEAVLARGGPDGDVSREIWAARAERAPELPFSVLIASYGSFESARERLDDWPAAGLAVPLLAPTPVRGAVYHRLFAGARDDRQAAEELMRRLVEAGEKDRASEWDVRPVPLAFRLGIHPDREEAAAALRSLREERIPAYLLPVAAGADTAWQVYAGAYDSSAAAEVFAEELRRAGLEAELVTRRGVAR